MISIGLARDGRGKGTDRKRGKKREQRCKEQEKDRMGRRGERGPNGSERDGVRQPEECFSWQRRGSGTGSVQSSQVSPREGDILLRVIHVPRSFGALRRAHRGPVVFRSFTLYSLTSFFLGLDYEDSAVRFYPPR